MIIAKLTFLQLVSLEPRMLRQLFRRINRDADLWIKTKKTPTLLQLNEIFIAFDIIIGDTMKRVLAGESPLDFDVPEGDIPKYEISFELNSLEASMQEIAERESHFSVRTLTAILMSAPRNRRKAIFRTSAKLVKLRGRAFKRNRKQYDEILNKFI